MFPKVLNSLTDPMRITALGFARRVAGIPAGDRERADASRAFRVATLTVADIH
jgi:hypothetical protein